MKRLTQEQLEAIRERAKVATEGIWVSADGGYVLDGNDWEGGYFVAECEREENAEFIAHAREDVPKLLAEVARLRKFVDTVTKPLDLVGLSKDGQAVKLEGVVFNFEEVLSIGK